MSKRGATAEKTIRDEFAQLPPGAVDAAISRLFPQPNEFADDPVRWMHDKLGHHLWSKEVDILESVRDHRLTAVKACHGPGKSFTGSGVVGHWMDSHALGSAFAITTAPSWPQVEAILWREIRRRYNEGDLVGRITQDCQWKRGIGAVKQGDPTEEIIAMGRKPADYDEDTFQGIHARFLLAVLDEACGIPLTLWTAVLALATNNNSRILALGNPDDPNSKFAEVCKPGSGWNVIQISVWDTPNFTGETDCVLCGAPLGEAVLESLVDHMYVEQARREWGEGSPVWISKVEGEFPDVSDEYLIAPALVELAQRTNLHGLQHGRYGLDVARMGVDKSVLYRNRGGQIRLVESWAKMDTMQSAGIAARHLRSHGLKRVPATVDIIGLGAGVFDRLKEQRLPVAPYQGSERAQNFAKFKNRRAESWWRFREMMEAGEIDLDPEDTALAAQLQSVKWGVDSQGRIFIESKEDMRDRGLPSPDFADAAILSTVEPAMALKIDEDAGRSITGDLMTRVM